METHRIEWRHHGGRLARKVWKAPLDAAVGALASEVAHLFEIGDQPGACRMPAEPSLRLRT